uniref:G_PROTEIN_RECEP_F1_2 domain-containing protein n=1 Tax=Angiostrongylus cantonensis TaxID=6313 RepID=A0A0K0D876_ANGCA
MLKLQKQQLGTDKNIPCFVPAACCFDNTFSIIIVSLTTAITDFFICCNHDEFYRADILCVRWVLWYFPLPNQKNTHTCRILLLIFLSILLGMNAVNHAFPGIVACLLACFVAPSRWRTDNPKKIEPVATFFAYTWYYVASPLLFSLVGTLYAWVAARCERHHHHCAVYISTDRANKLLDTKFTED